MTKARNHCHSDLPFKITGSRLDEYFHSARRQCKTLTFHTAPRSPMSASASERFLTADRLWLFICDGGVSEIKQKKLTFGECRAMRFLSFHDSFRWFETAVRKHWKIGLREVIMTHVCSVHFIFGKRTGELHRNYVHDFWLQPLEPFFSASNDTVSLSDIHIIHIKAVGIGQIQN